MLVELAQTNIKLGDKKNNLNKAVRLIRESNADLILFPELFTTGMDYEHIRELSEPIDGDTIKKLLKISTNKIIAGSIIEQDGVDIYNTLVFVEDTRLVGFYRKIHLFRNEKKYFKSGDEIKVINTRYGLMGLSICYDIRFPQLYGKQTDKGAIIMLVCANFPRQRIMHWRTLLAARAIENQCYVLGCNRVGADNTNEYNGYSMILDPYGRILAEAGGNEQNIMHEIDSDIVVEYREKFPIQKDNKLR
ncbi:MAG: carbon-nitrogen hydrolase [Candidatus Altiarchaeales archaeon ex4484_96]|nr:MAG: carbon-nitrogen hydrolase [Candidatus Altiarchaeales archaeon ex4484_96]